MKIKLYADTADLALMTSYYENKTVSGFTTNPSLMKAAGIEDYNTYVKEVLSVITDLPVSFEVFGDDEATMEKEALKIATFGKNVIVKIPIITTDGTSLAPLIKRLSDQGVNLNVTAITTLEQVKETVDAVNESSYTIVSVFAGRLADVGIDPVPLMKASAEYCHTKQNVELLWASNREVFNIMEADRIGCDIITCAPGILNKLGNLGKSAMEISLDTVRTFQKDIADLGYSIL